MGQDGDGPRMPAFTNSRLDVWRRDRRPHRDNLPLEGLLRNLVNDSGSSRVGSQGIDLNPWLRVLAKTTASTRFGTPREHGPSLKRSGTRASSARSGCNIFLIRRQ